MLQWIEKNLLWLGITFLILGLLAGGGIYMVIVKSRKEFVDKMKPIALKIRDKYGIQTNITITQSAHESGWGMSKLTREANNLFGFTATDSWIKEGKPVYNIETKEYIRGAWVTLKRPFRKYKSWDDSVDDWAKIISGLTRYSEAYRYAHTGDIANYGIAVQKGGYATDPQYAKKLASLGKTVEGMLV